MPGDRSPGSRLVPCSRGTRPARHPTSERSGCAPTDHEIPQSADIVDEGCWIGLLVAPFTDELATPRSDLEPGERLARVRDRRHLTKEGRPAAEGATPRCNEQLRFAEQQQIADCRTRINTANCFCFEQHVERAIWSIRHDERWQRIAVDLADRPQTLDEPFDRRAYRATVDKVVCTAGFSEVAAPHVNTDLDFADVIRAPDPARAGQSSQLAE